MKYEWIYLFRTRQLRSCPAVCVKSCPWIKNGSKMKVSIEEAATNQIFFFLSFSSQAVHHRAAPYSTKDPSEQSSSRYLEPQAPPAGHQPQGHGRTLPPLPATSTCSQVSFIPDVSYCSQRWSSHTGITVGIVWLYRSTAKTKRSQRAPNRGIKSFFRKTLNARRKDKHWQNTQQTTSQCRFCTLEVDKIYFLGKSV